MKKITNKKGIAIITSLGVCFVLLALGTVIMINSYSHMSIAQKFRYETEALNIAEAGVIWNIYKMEKNTNFSSISNVKDANEPFGKGKFFVSIYNNSTGTGTYYWADEKLSIPPHCIGVRSKGILKDGSYEASKTVKTIVGYQLVPYTVCSEGVIRMNVANDEATMGTEPIKIDISDPDPSELNAFTALINSIDGFTGSLHSNYDSTTEPSYRCTLHHDNHVNLDVKGGIMSSSGIVGGEATTKINTHGGKALSNRPKRTFFKTDYSKLYKKAEEQSKFISLDSEVPSVADFLGEMKNDGGTLKGRVKIPIIGKKWFDITNVPVYGNCLPKGLSWDSATGTLIIEEGKNYKWDNKKYPNLSLSGVNIKVKGTKSTGLFVNGNVTANNIEITANAFCLASNDKTITLNNAKLNITAPETSDGVALYTRNLIITTDKNSVPPGGNKFKGIVYANGGTIDLTNQYTGLTDNNLTLEGLVMNPKNGSITPSLKVKNKGNDNFKMELKYNPYVANAMIDYNNTGNIKLQTLYWEID